MAPSTDDGNASPISSGGGEADPGSSVLSDGTFLDASVVHELSVESDQDEYDSMVEEFASTGDKTWIEATVVVDGERYERAGMRLKGNSSLAGLEPEEVRSASPFANVGADQPEALPWLIRLDKFVDGQNHRGIFDLVVRSNVSQTSLNEAVALDLLAAAGLASQDAAWARFSVNGGVERLRLVIELPEDVWMEAAFGSGGALYKGRSDGNFDYLGADPDAYEDPFSQQGGEDNFDLAPLIDFIGFVNNADEADFDAELPGRLDVEGFATYLAMQDLMQNFDDINGPGNNAYFYYDDASASFTVVPWDMNFALAGMGVLSDGGPQAEALGIPPFGPHVLVDRFLATPAFKARFDDALVELNETLYEGGVADDILSRWVEVLEDQATDLVDPETIGIEADRVAAHFETSG